MKLGTETNSLINHLYSRGTIGQPAPKVGMGATMLGWTDRHAGTITKVTEYTGKLVRWEVEVTYDDAKVVSGSEHDGSAVYEFSPGTGTRQFAFYLKTQSWEEFTRNPETGKRNKQRGYGLRIGDRDHYRDPSF